MGGNAIEGQAGAKVRERSKRYGYFGLLKALLSVAKAFAAVPSASFVCGSEDEDAEGSKSTLKSLYSGGEPLRHTALFREKKA